VIAVAASQPFYRVGDKVTQFFIDIAPKIPYIFGAMFKREINPAKTKSYFLFGPRQTGKNTFVKSLISPKDLYFDLLPQRTFLN
jgi:predicted AAA+ superfamily ATPase